MRQLLETITKAKFMFVRAIHLAGQFVLIDACGGAEVAPPAPPQSIGFDSQPGSVTHCFFPADDSETLLRATVSQLKLEIISRHYRVTLKQNARSNPRMAACPSTGDMVCPLIRSVS